jgi:Leucine-rich repeat (LRR) protein
LAHLAGLANLEQLDLAFTSVGDVGLVQVKLLSKLSELNLSHTKITDAGLDTLKGLANLRSLDLTSTKVSESGVARLRRQRPELQIKDDQGVGSLDDVRFPGLPRFNRPSRTTPARDAP